MGEPEGTASFGRNRTVTKSCGPLKRVKHYGLLSLIGKGGMGEVYLAQDAKLDRRVAVKFLPDSLNEEPKARERFLREAKAAAALDHPFICKVFEAGEFQGRSYIVMEYVEGKSLRDLIAEGPIPLPDALKAALEVAEALEAAHDKGIVHRDLKPANLMCTPQGHIKVMDFGLAKHVVSGETDVAAGALSRTMTADPGRQSITTPGMVVGTIAYMSPEQARGEPVDARTDIFSLGVVLMEMISGKHPFDKPTPIETLTSVLRDSPPPVHVKPKALIPDVGRILNRAMAKDASARYAKIGEMAADIRDLLIEVAPGRWLGFKNPWVRAAAAVAGVAVLAVIGLYLLRPPGAGGPAPSPESVSVLITDVENRTGDPMFDGVLEQLLSIGLGGAEHISVYERGQARDLILRLDPAAEGRLTPQNARPLCVREGIQTVISASIRQEKNGYLITVRAEDSLKGRVLAETDQPIREKKDILKVADLISAKLMDGLGLIPEDSSEALIKETFTTTSLEAMKAYADAQDLSAKGKNEDAIAAYNRAVDLDPNFGRAYAGLAAGYYARGEMQLAEGFYQEALERIGQMTDREKHRTRGGYYLFMNNFKRAIEEYTALLKLFPKDVAGRTNLALAHFMGYRMREAFEEGLGALEYEPDNLDNRYNQSWYALASGDFARAKQEARKTLEIEPSYVKAFVVLALADVAEGRNSEAAGLYGQAAALGQQGGSFGATGAADLAVYEGRLDEAAKILEAGIAADVKSGSDYRAADKSVVLAKVRSLRGDNDRAAEAAERAVKLSGREETLFAAAQVLMEAGREDRARSIAGDLGKRVQDVHQAYAKMIGGYLSLSRGDTANAVRCFDEAQAFADTWLGRFALGRAYVEAGAFTEALSEFEKCEKRRGEALSVFLNDLPTARYLDSLEYYVGRAEEGLGKSAAARDAYQAFLKIKANADPGQALVEDARRRLGVL
jgi:tetratricopeptide (TPR) repeat protein/tRNA A-37 threonylcarbamoyl transferase component Bud32